MKNKRIKIGNAYVMSSTIKKWVKALRSGEYKQGINALQTEDKFCCLGVACDMFIPKHKQVINMFGIKGELPQNQPYAPRWLTEIENERFTTNKLPLYTLNDDGKTFKEIANIIESRYLK